jgi:hypothetical protein
MRTPDFIVIGAAKSGTTTLYDHLVRRDDIFMTTPKEPEFFARDDRYDAGIEAYAALYDRARPDQVCGEASTLYTLSPHFPKAAARAAAFAPDAKLIYMMREPVARAYSFYGQMLKAYQNNSGDPGVHRSFEDCVQPDRSHLPRDKFFGPYNAHYPDVPGVFLDAGDYPMQIRAWMEHYPRERFLFLTFEEFVRDPAAVLARLHAFLGLPPEAEADAPAGPAAASNAASDHIERLRRDRFAAELSGRAPILGRISRAMPPAWRSALRELAFRFMGARVAANRPDVAPPKMLPETRAVLEARYGAQRAELAALTGLDLDRWWTRRP